MQKKTRNLLWASFVAYCTVMCYLLFARSAYSLGRPYLEELKMNINFIPFETIRGYIIALIYRRNEHLIYNAFINLCGNIVAFIPLGLFLPCLWKKLQLLKNLLLCSGITVLTIELIQLVTLRGSCDIDDFILNLFGILLGFLSWKGLSRTLLKWTL